MEARIAAAAARLLGEAPRAVRAVGGGDVCHAFRVELADGRRLFAKSPRAQRPGMLEEEARGLAWLGEARALPVARVVAVGEATEGLPALLLLEWIEPGRPRHDFDECLGRGLAALHRAGAPRFGLARDNWIGPLPQSNRPSDDWARFYGQQRLAPLLAQVRDAGRLPRSVAKRAEALLVRLPARVGPPEPPARLHGDLWRGNVLVSAAGEPVLVDPAVYGGHREVDLAMMRLFGGFSPACFDAYAEAAPLAPGHAERVPLYQLYPLLVHVALFGGGYASSFADALARCEARG